jgi:hypothetical protein
MVQNLGWQPLQQRPGSDYVCLDINKLMYDLEHDDETVVISSLLKWLPAKVLYYMSHATVSKANRTMGFIRRNLRDCTKPVKAAAYTTMARPTLEYASTVWDPHSSAETHCRQLLECDHVECIVLV